MLLKRNELDFEILSSLWGPNTVRFLRRFSWSVCPTSHAHALMLSSKMQYLISGRRAVEGTEKEKKGGWGVIQNILQQCDWLCALLAEVSAVRSCGQCNSHVTHIMESYT